MTPIAETRALAELCRRLAGASFVCVDTEFIRERCYWPRLCLVQLAAPDGEAVAVDPLAAGLDLAPLIELLADRRVLKVFHAARQDLEIFFHLSGRVPGPLFDTQVAAMVCGFGEAASYETLVRRLADGRTDKASRFTDWARRPLTDRQLDYALADVGYLPAIYAELARRLDETGRGEWVAEEMAELADPATYRIVPEEVWRRIKTRNTRPRFLAVLRELALVRERWAQDRDLPRNRLVRDEVLLDIAAHLPETPEALAHTRGLARGVAQGPLGGALLDAVERGRAVPEADCPRLAEPGELPPGMGPLADLLKVLLRMRCEEHGVAQKLVATAADLEAIAADDHAPVHALHGWRREVFGEDALALKHGRLALGARSGRIAVFTLAE